MRDTFFIALYAAKGAGVSGVLGTAALRLLRRHSITLSLTTVVVVPVGAVLGGTICVFRGMLLSDHDVRIVTVICATAAVVSLAVAFGLGRTVVKGTHALTETTRALGDGVSLPHLPATPTAELTAIGLELAQTSIRLAASREREAALDRSRRELVAWISHDLRTPLAGLQALAEAQEDGVLDDLGVYHARIRAEVERLSGMVGDLFELSRLQIGVRTMNTARTSVYDLVDDALAGVHLLASERGVRLVGDGVEAVPIEADSREMSRVLANLLVNAIRRTPPDGTVAVSAHREHDAVVLSVTDQCGGIAAEDLPRVFDSGWRGTDARTPPPGAGLGLAIVRGIVEAHQGQTCVSNVPGGCRFEVRLPAAV
ncbi:HAMP domain-containing sensor histidine kinase [Streptomyces sp. Lzd4kr]|nr:HAMP domain-containing sensor histidine kinase [Streptomyces sp. Lzd4kr]